MPCRLSGTAGDPPPASRIGHVAVAIDATATWGTELLVVHGGIGEDKHALRCAQAARRPQGTGLVDGWQLDTSIHGKTVPAPRSLTQLHCQHFGLPTCPLPMTPCSQPSGSRKSVTPPTTCARLSDAAIVTASHPASALKTVSNIQRLP